MDNIEPDHFHEVLKILANLEADLILEKNPLQNIELINTHLPSFNERVDEEIAIGNDDSIRAFKALTYNLYRMRDRFSDILNLH